MTRRTSGAYDTAMSASRSRVRKKLSVQTTMMRNHSNGQWTTSMDFIWKSKIISKQTTVINWTFQINNNFSFSLTQYTTVGWVKRQDPDILQWIIITEQVERNLRRRRRRRRAILSDSSLSFSSIIIRRACAHCCCWTSKEDRFHISTQ